MSISSFILVVRRLSGWKLTVSFGNENCSVDSAMSWESCFRPGSKGPKCHVTLPGTSCPWVQAGM